MNDTPESRIGLAIDQASEIAVFWLDRDGSIEWWGPGAAHVFGHDPSDIVGQDGERLFVPEDAARGLPKHELSVARTSGVGEDDRWHLRADGSRFWGTGFVVATRDAQGDLLGYAKVVRNRTDLKEQIETLRNNVTALQEAGRRKDVFLATLSHELRNVLAPLTTGIGIVRRSIRTSPEIDLGIRIVERQVELMRSLVDDLLDLARIGEGKVVLAREPIALERIVEQAVEAHRPVAAQRSQQVNVLFPAKATLVDVDPHRMQQVVTNLLDNAIKYTPERGVISINTNVEGDEAVLRIEDSGIGIPLELQPMIFELFTQVERPSAGAKGLGIGLSLVKDIVTMHGGTVQVRSEGPGKGSEFTVRLPLAGTTSADGLRAGSSKAGPETH